MARLAVQGDSGSEDEFSVLVKETKVKRSHAPASEKKPIRRLKATSSPRKPTPATGVPGTPNTASRRRKIGVLKENPLMKRWNSKEGQAIEISDLSEEEPTKTPARLTATRKQALKALQERTRPRYASNDDGDSDNFQESDEEPSVASQAPTRLQPRRAAAAKKLFVESSSDGDDYDDEVYEGRGSGDWGGEEDVPVNEGDNGLSSAPDSMASGIGLDSSLLSPRAASSVIVPPEHAASVCRPPREKDSAGVPIRQEGKASSDEDIDRQLQEQLAEDMSWAAERRCEPPTSGHKRAQPDSSDTSDDFEDARESLEDQKDDSRECGSEQVPAKALREEKPQASRRAFAIKRECLSESSSLFGAQGGSNVSVGGRDVDHVGVGMSDYDGDDLLEDSESNGNEDNSENDEDGDEDSDETDGEDNDSDFREEGSASDVEEEPRPKVKYRPRRVLKTSGRGRFALQSRSGNITSSSTHEVESGDAALKRRDGPNLEESFQRLQLIEEDTLTMKPGDLHPRSRPNDGLVSPRKTAPIPKTPHRPSSDIFWSQSFVNDWNDVHSPRKLFGTGEGPVPKQRSEPTTSLPPTQKSRAITTTSARTKSEKAARKAFEEGKAGLAVTFLRALDENITGGELEKMAASTGGVKIVWTKHLNTTAGRANWKRETIRPSSATSSVSENAVKHHASIELASKVITEESRLFNVVAHEFCHLANFMVTGETGNPHGKSFKAWAAKVTRNFGNSHGIEVTTKHNYDIDYRYIWSCEDCGLEYKRHSRSIDTSRHRCGGCKGKLQQIKPVPRGNGRGAAGSAKNEDSRGRGTGSLDSTSTLVAKKTPTEYQVFMKEQMRILRRENPGRPQTVIMKLVAEKWTRNEKSQDIKLPQGVTSNVNTQKAEFGVIDLTREE